MSNPKIYRFPFLEEHKVGENVPVDAPLFVMLDDYQKLEQQRAFLCEDARKYHTQLLECKRNWHAMKQQRDELLSVAKELSASVKRISLSSSSTGARYE
jgi:thioesterase domain-containing protein